MLNLEGHEPDPASRGHAEHREAGCLGAWVDADLDALDDRGFDRPVHQADHERRQAVDPGSPGRKELARPGWVARHERTSVAVDHEHPCCGDAGWDRKAPISLSFGLLRARGVTPQPVGEPGWNLPSTMLAASCPPLPVGVHAPFRPYPGVVC